MPGPDRVSLEIGLLARMRLGESRDPQDNYRRLINIRLATSRNGLHRIWKPVTPKNSSRYGGSWMALPTDCPLFLLGGTRRPTISRNHGMAYKCPEL